MKNIAIFASGNGSNAERIIKYFDDSPTAQVNVVFTNNNKAGVIKRAHSLFVDVQLLSRDDFTNTKRLLKIIEQYNTNLIVLAGFMWLVPDALIRNYPNKIINIHPALLPNYGGKGMYGMRVHEAVISAGDSKSGITIHKVNRNYDDGQIIFQMEVGIDANDTPDSLAEKIHMLEYEYFPEVIENFLLENK